MKICTKSKKEIKEGYCDACLHDTEERESKFGCDSIDAPNDFLARIKEHKNYVLVSDEPISYVLLMGMRKMLAEVKKKVDSVVAFDENDNEAILPLGLLELKQWIESMEKELDK